MFCNLTGPDQIGPTQNEDQIVPFEKESKFTDGGNCKQCDICCIPVEGFEAGGARWGRRWCPAAPRVLPVICMLRVQM